MSVFGSMMSKIFGHHAAASNTASATPAPAAPAAAPASAPAAAPASAPVATVNAHAVLKEMASHHSQKLDWENSIVDLMKLVGIDSSMVNRRAMATELGYTGDLNDSAPMNIWLQQEVMRRFSENGGNVPANLLD